MKICPACKGTKVALCAVIEIGGVAEEELALPCPTCEGEGKVTLHQWQVWQAEQEMWCDCGNPSGEVAYHTDTPDMKHHYTCKDCGKVVQVG